MISIISLYLWIIFAIIGQISAISYNQPKFCANATWHPHATTFSDSSTSGQYQWGLFINTNNTIYIADFFNHRIQIWLNNTHQPTQTISDNLYHPFFVFVTDNGDLYIDNGEGNHRVDKRTLNSNSSVPVIVVKRWLNNTSMTSTIVAGTGVAGNMSNQLNEPTVMSTTIAPKVTSIRKGWLLKIIDNNKTSFLEQTTPSIQQATSTEKITTVKPVITNQTCFPPNVILIPSTTTLSSPTSFRRSQDFYIISIIDINCETSITINTRWTIKNCTSICSNEIELDATVDTTLSELYIPGRTLPYGIFELTLKVAMVNMSNLTSSSSAYVRITASGITVNLFQYGTSMITRGNQQDLRIGPGSYSVDPDRDFFNSDDWKYVYYCRIYGLYTFPNIQGSLLPIDDMRNDSSNPSCLSNRTGWKYSDSIRSSLTILSNSLQPNRTYQFMVYLQNRQNPSSQATGYALVKIDNQQSQMILIGCVIWTMCIPNLEFQLVNPTTQVALFSVCTGDCSTLQNITWNVYYSTNDSSANVITWIFSNQTITHQDIWFFGRNTSNFTATSQLFLSNPMITLWRFEILCTFSSAKSLSSLNFVINQPPTNGSCSINPLNGTITTLFDISCSNWMDKDGIKDYALFARIDDSKKKTIVAYSAISNFQVRLPAGDNQTSLLHLTIHIRDTLDCIIVLNISTVHVQADLVEITNLIDNINSQSNTRMTNPIVQSLASENQNIVSQLINSLSQEFNKMNNEIVNQATSNGISTASISISSLTSQILQPVFSSNNQSALNEFQKELNLHANVREYLISFTTKLAITTPNSIQLQASALAQLTQATNQLTRTTLTIVSNRCYQLTMALYAMLIKIPYEDVQAAAYELLQCAANILSAVNGPLQKRTDLLNSDISVATKFPADYDTDLESEWSNLNLFVDENDFSVDAIGKGRNIYYQKQLANQIFNQMNKIILLLTSLLNTHLNVGQNSVFDTSQIFMSLETKSSESLSSTFLKKFGNAQIQLPADLIQQSKVSIRTLMSPLAIYGNSTFQSITITNCSRLISFSILDQNEQEIPIQTNTNHSIELIIPRDPNLLISSMSLQNVTAMNSMPHDQLFQLHYRNLTSLKSISIHFEIVPLNTNISYLFIYKFDGIPQLNSSINQIDGWKLFCSFDLINETIYNYFLDNQKTSGHQSIVFGLRELNLTEIDHFCSNVSIMNPPIRNERFYFTSNYQLRTYTSGCYYLDKNNQWTSDGLIVGPLTNHYQTQCFATHLTSFAGGFLVLPEPVNWSYVFANADFLRNKTIYVTVICVSIIYILLMIYARWKDKKDMEKLGVTPLPDNHKSDGYFYQIIVFTDQTSIRTFADPHRRILQRGGIDAFIMAVPHSLGLLNCIRIWHDNSGKDSSSSWFLKYIIIRDLQTMEKFHFISQRWFSVEKDDGKIERVLPVANESEKHDFTYLITKGTYHSVSDGHLWFSIFSRPPSNQFTRVQRCTCCFVLFFVSMFLNIMYYDLSNETETNNSTSTTKLAFGSLYITREQIGIGIIVEVFALIPSLLLVQLFRRLQPRRKQHSPLRQALYKIKATSQMFVDKSYNNELVRKKTNRKSRFIFPWWFIFLAYGLCAIFVGLSILFIIARGIEFGDLKSQQWLTSILSGFFSSILLTQPIKIITLAIIFACFCRKSNDDKEANEFLDDNQVDLNNDEEYLHQNPSLFIYQRTIQTNRLCEEQIVIQRDQRMKEIYMWSIIRELLLCLCFLSFLYTITYSIQQSNSFLQVDHLRKYFLNSRQIDCDYIKISTIDQYWNWLENSFVENLRAQQWYNDEQPKNLNGFINDKSNRLIGWATMRQLRIRSQSCQVQKELISICHHDYSLFNEDKNSYKPRWSNQTLQNYSAIIRQSFQYRSSKELDTYMYVGNYGSYVGGGYVYEFRGRLSDLRSNLSQLQQLGWIDRQTRAVLIEFTLYNPNVQLFTSVTFLIEILSTNGVYPSARFEPVNFSTFTSIHQLICIIIYMLLIIYFMWIEIRLLIELKWKYFHRFWSYIDNGIIICSWTSIGIYIWRYHEYQRISQLFEQTNGYININLQFIVYINDILTYLYGFCCFFGTIKLIRLCRFNQRLNLFLQTLKYARKRLLSFGMMFSIVFLSFVCLFYLLFISKISSTATLLSTIQILFEMTLMNFDAQELSGAAAFLGPFCFCLYIIFVVFICMSMFISIIYDSYQHAKENFDHNQEIVTFMTRRWQQWTGLRKLGKDDIQEEKDVVMRSQYNDPIECFPERMDRLLDALNRIYVTQRSNESKLNPNTLS
ncbi:hypothetical protein I4U23_003769 [Adineta vaga]|nr:hypothetical protein I4U23_003769 [Adineta vaga]